MKEMEDTLASQKPQDLPWEVAGHIYWQHESFPGRRDQPTGKTSWWPTGQLGRFTGGPDSAWGSQRVS